MAPISIVTTGPHFNPQMTQCLAIPLNEVIYSLKEPGQDMVARDVTSLRAVVRPILAQAANREHARRPLPRSKPFGGSIVGRVLFLLLLVGHTSTVRAGDPLAGTVEPINRVLCESMKVHNVLNTESPVDCQRLNLIKFSYVDFEGRNHADGEIAVMDAVAEHVVQIFGKIHEMHFPIAKARLMDLYEGNDDASMADNNTSAFNSRRVVGGNSLSLHAYGLAIDINPIRNPYIKRSGDRLIFKPPAGVEYANRLNDRPFKNTRSGMAEAVIDVFANDGFLTWGGYWNDPIDYQHFQVSGNLAEQLVHLTPIQSRTTFDQYVERYRTCRRTSIEESNRSKCIMAIDANSKASQP